MTVPAVDVDGVADGTAGLAPSAFLDAPVALPGTAGGARMFLIGMGGFWAVTGCGGFAMPLSSLPPQTLTIFNSQVSDLDAFSSSKHTTLSAILCT